MLAGCVRSRTWVSGGRITVAVSGPSRTLIGGAYLEIYRDLEFAIRPSRGRSDAWVWTLYVSKARKINGIHVGTENGARRAAHQAIDRWLGKRRHPKVPLSEAASHRRP